MFPIWGMLSRPAEAKEAPDQKFYYSTSVGQIVSADGSGYVLPAISENSIEKIDFIPLEYAQSKIKEISKENLNACEAYQKQIAEIKFVQVSFVVFTVFREQYKSALDDSKDHYETIIKDMKKKALRHVEIQKQMRTQLEEKYTEQLRTSEEKIDDLRDNMATLNSEYQEEVRKLKSKLSSTEKRMEQYLKSLQTLTISSETKAKMDDMIFCVQERAFAESMKTKSDSIYQRMKTAAKEQLGREKRKYDGLLKDAHDSQFRRAECRGVLDDILHTIEINEQRELMMTQFELQTQIQALQETIDASGGEMQSTQGRIAELLEQQEQLKAQLSKAAARNKQLMQFKAKYDRDEVELCMSGMLATLVEMHHNSSHRDHSSRLQQQEAELLVRHRADVAEQQANLERVHAAYDEKLKKLKGKFHSILNDLKAQKDAMEVRLILHQLVGEVVDRSTLNTGNVASSPSVETIPMTPAPMPASDPAAAASSPTKRSSDSSAAMVPAAQFDDTRNQLLAAMEQNRQLSAKVQALEKKLDSMPRETASTKTVVMAAPLTEAGDNRMLQKQREELEPRLRETIGKLRGLESALENMNRDKETTKNDITEWTREFRDANGRDPEPADKAAIKDKYQKYKTLSTKTKELEGKIEALAKEKADIESQLKALEAASPAPLVTAMPSGILSPQAISVAPRSPLVPIAVVSDGAKPDVSDFSQQVGDAELRPGLKRTGSALDKLMAQQAKLSPRSPRPAEAAIPENTEAKSDAPAGLSEEEWKALVAAHEQDCETIEQLEDQLYQLKLDYRKAMELNAKIEEDKTTLSTQLEALIKEKRTDVVKRYEEEIEKLQKIQTELNEAVTALKAEKLKNETKITELKSRAELAEKELKDKAAEEAKMLTPGEEKTALKTQINKQRDEIILKSKAATAGWDAAANADEKLELDVQRAYRRGLNEQKEQHQQDMVALNSALEVKENRITELMVSIADMERRVKVAGEEREAMRLQMEQMKVEVADTIAGLTSMGLGGGSAEALEGPTSAELEQAREELDSAQEELITLMDRCDKLERDLDVARKKNRIFEQLATMTGLTAGVAAPVGGASGGGKMAGSKSKGALREGTPNNFDVNDAIGYIKQAIVKGSNLWKSNRKDDCFDVNLDACQYALDRVITSALRAPLEDCMTQGKNLGLQNKQRGAVALRKGMDRFLNDAGSGPLRKAEDDAVAEMKNKEAASIESENAANQSTVTDLMEKLNSIDNGFLEQGYTREKNPANSNSAGDAAVSPRANESGASLLKRAKAAEDQVISLKKQLAAVINATAQQAAAPAADTGAAAGARPTTASTRVAALKPTPAIAAGGADPVEVRRLNRKIKELEEQVKKLNAAGAGGLSAADQKAMQANEKALQKKIKDLETNSKREAKNLEMRAVKAENALQKIEGTYKSITSERDQLKAENVKLFNMTSEIGSLKAKADHADELEKTLAARDTELSTLQESFKKETALRKKYKNELEDLKGAVRVYARCRPMSNEEKRQGYKTVVDIKDETSLTVRGSRGDKEFEFDAVFGPASTQDQVFEDTKRLVESCLDGYNVCLFAYGQTGSGKTFTMTGSPQLPGLTPKAINELYRLMDERVHLNCKVTTYFVELYNDNLVDLYWVLDNKNSKVNTEPPKLDIKMDAKKMVYIRNSVIKDASSPEELMDLFVKGNGERHTGATRMNAESSRSHSIFAIMVECYDTATKKTTTGKLSLVDLAGSERQDKTGATADRLKEAQSINKSLSALGDVINGLTEGAKFIPYRNNKLTQVMQDSLGGNAKTLMFVNFSPSDYNCDETTTSLMYASRVKKIVNNAAKQTESAEVAKLKAIIKKLLAGQNAGDIGVDLDGNKEEEEEPEPPPVEDDGKVYDGY